MMFILILFINNFNLPEEDFKKYNLFKKIIRNFPEENSKKFNDVIFLKKIQEIFRVYTLSFTLHYVNEMARSHMNINYVNEIGPKLFHQFYQLT